MTRFYLLLSMCFLLALPACKPHKVCSGLNPELATYGTVKRVKKAKRRMGSDPERKAVNHREKSMKKKKGFSAKGKYSKKGGLFNFRASGSAKVGKK